MGYKRTRNIALHPFRKGDVVYCNRDSSRNRWRGNGTYYRYDELSGKTLTVSNVWFCKHIPYMTFEGHHKSWGCEGFVLVERKTEKENTMQVQLAVRIPEALRGHMINEVVDWLNNHHRTITGQIAATTPHELKRKVIEAIKEDPETRWLILHGSQIAELDVPPVRFRDI